MSKRNTRTNKFPKKVIMQEKMVRDYGSKTSRFERKLEKQENKKCCEFFKLIYFLNFFTRFL